jgi:hypothetical protein
VDKVLEGKKHDVVLPEQMDREKLLDALKKETMGKDWAGVSTLGEDGERIVDKTKADENGHLIFILEDGERIAYKTKADENGHLIFIRDKDVPESAVECQEAEKSEDAGFILPVPTTKLDERDLPEYVLNAFLHPMPGYTLQSTVECGHSVTIAYVKDTNYFQATLAIGAERRLVRRMTVSSVLKKDGAVYSVTGNFLDFPRKSDELSLEPEFQPRAARLYGYLCEKLGLD